MEKHSAWLISLRNDTSFSENAHPGFWILLHPKTMYLFFSHFQAPRHLMDKSIAPEDEVGKKIFSSSQIFDGSGPSIAGFNYSENIRDKFCFSLEIA